MKKIGLTQRIVKEKKHGEIRNCLDLRWYELLHSIDLVPTSISSFKIYYL